MKLLTLSVLLSAFIGPSAPEPGDYLALSFADMPTRGHYIYTNGTVYYAYDSKTGESSDVSIQDSIYIDMIFVHCMSIGLDTMVSEVNIDTVPADRLEHYASFELRRGSKTHRVYWNYEDTSIKSRELNNVWNLANRLW